jgi:hypothetical protein
MPSISTALLFYSKAPHQLDDEVLFMQLPNNKIALYNSNFPHSNINQNLENSILKPK